MIIAASIVGVYLVWLLAGWILIDIVYKRKEVPNTIINTTILTPFVITVMLVFAALNAMANRGSRK